MWGGLRTHGRVRHVGQTGETRAKIYRSVEEIHQFGDAGFMSPLQRAIRGAKSDYLNRTMRETLAAPIFLISLWFASPLIPLYASPFALTLLSAMILQKIAY